MQMQRYREAGLSPYLIYGQGNSGNVNSPAPSYGVESAEKGFDSYVAASNFRHNLKMQALERERGRIQNDLLEKKDGWQTIQNIRHQLDTWSDYPDLGYFGDDLDKDKVVKNSFRRKVNELKLATSEAALEKIGTAIEGMRSKNIIERIKARYAEDFGMVGGDWTQGLGLLKSIPSFFKKPSRNVNPQHRELIRSYERFKGDQYRRNANRFLFEQLKP